jgi:hypothetical protein
MIQKLENEKEADAMRKLEDRTALAEAKKRGKEAFEAEKARIARDKLAASEAKNQEKLRLEAIKQAKKAQLAAEKKAKAAQRKVRVQCVSDQSLIIRRGNGKPLSKTLKVYLKVSPDLSHHQHQMPQLSFSTESQTMAIPNPVTTNSPFTPMILQIS